MDIYLTRTPVFESTGELYGYEMVYELLSRENVYKNETETAEPEEIENEFFGIDVKTVSGVSGSRAFIKFTPEMIRNKRPLAIPPELLVVQVSPNQFSGSEKLIEHFSELHERGYMIAVDDYKHESTDTELFNLCDFVKLSFRSTQKALDETAYVCRYTNKRIIAKEIDSRENFDYARKVGCAFVQGSFFLKPAKGVSSIQPLPTSIVQVMQIMSSPDPEIKDIVEVLEHDSAVCQKILRLINSAYFGFTNKISSISQAIIVLGMNYLREWIYLLAMQHITQNDNTEFIRLALVMAKFCKKIAEKLPEAANDKDAFYLMGLLSMLVFSGDRILAIALEEFPLTNDIKSGLLQRGGIYSDVFEMAMGFTRGDWDHFAAIASAYKLDRRAIAGLYAECLSEADKTNLG